MSESPKCFHISLRAASLSLDTKKKYTYFMKPSEGLFYELVSGDVIVEPRKNVKVNVSCWEYLQDFQKVVLKA